MTADTDSVDWIVVNPAAMPSPRITEHDLARMSRPLSYRLNGGPVYVRQPDGTYQPLPVRNA